MSPLQKEPAIREVVERLRADLGEDVFVICDHWDADLCAIGIARLGAEATLAYISTHRRTAGTYYLELEQGTLAEPDGESVGQWDGLDYEHLRQLVSKHLGVSKPLTS